MNETPFELYSRHAREVDALAAKTQQPHEREALQAVAKQWRRLAEEAKTRSGIPGGGRG